MESAQKLNNIYRVEPNTLSPFFVIDAPTDAHFEAAMFSRYEAIKTRACMCSNLDFPLAYPPA